MDFKEIVEYFQEFPYMTLQSVSIDRSKQFIPLLSFVTIRLLCKRDTAVRLAIKYS